MLLSRELFVAVDVVVGDGWTLIKLWESVFIIWQVVKSRNIGEARVVS